MRYGGFSCLLADIEFLYVLLVRLEGGCEAGYLRDFAGGLDEHHFDILRIELVFFALGLQHDIFFCHT